MYNICNLLLVLGACTGNRKQSTPKPLSSKSLKTFHATSHIIHSSGYRGENLTRGLSVLFVVLCPMNALVTQSHLFQPQNSLPSSGSDTEIETVKSEEYTATLRPSVYQNSET